MIQFLKESGLTMVSQSFAKAFAGIAVLALVAGCSAIPGSNPPVQLYSLTPKSTYPDELPVVDWQLGVERPTAPAGLATARIAAVRTPLTLDYFANVLWVDDAPNMVQRLLIESFENSNRIVGVGRASVGLRSDYVLRIELREFQAEYREPGEPPTIFVRVNTKLVKMPERQIVASVTRDKLMKAPDGKITSIIKTFDSALGKVLKQIVIWTLSTAK